MSTIFIFHFIFSCGVFMGSTLSQFSHVSKAKFSEVVKVLVFSFLWPLVIIGFVLILVDELGKAFKLWS